MIDSAGNIGIMSEFVQIAKPTKDKDVQVTDRSRVPCETSTHSTDYSTNNSTNRIIFDVWQTDSFTSVFSWQKTTYTVISASTAVHHYKIRSDNFSFI